MTTRFKDFGSGTDTTVSEPISFMIYGEEFHCAPALQGKALLGFVSESQSADPATQASVIEKFFDKVLLEESLERFTTLQESKDRIVSVETLSEILGWVVEQYTVRPN
jgi:hypothetical protein